MCVLLEIEDEAVDLVREKIKEVKSKGVAIFGKNRAIQTLLCELYKLKKSNPQGQGATASLL